MSKWEIPQFVLISFNGAITPQAYDLYRPLSIIRSPEDSCPLKPTWYVNVAQGTGSDSRTLTECHIVKGLVKSGHEIATHTYGEVREPTKDDILNAVEWLNQQCDVPLSDMRGFRTPNLGFTQDTFDILASDTDILYDSSIADSELGSGGGRYHWWPYTMDDGIVQSCVSSAGHCDKSAPNPGLWEVPLWRLYDANGFATIPIDWWSNDGIEAMLDRNLELRNEGNRAPLAINVKISWLAINGDALESWINKTMTNRTDVRFVTTYELLQWMRDPVPLSQYSRDCTNLDTTCFIPPQQPDGGCGHGRFDPDGCKCICNHPWGGTNCLTKISDKWTPPPTPKPTGAPTPQPSALPTITFRPTTFTDMPTMMPVIDGAEATTKGVNNGTGLNFGQNGTYTNGNGHHDETNGDKTDSPDWEEPPEFLDSAGHERGTTLLSTTCGLIAATVASSVAATFLM